MPSPTGTVLDQLPPGAASRTTEPPTPGFLDRLAARRALATLPAGFTVDGQQLPPHPLPPGFVLDTPVGQSVSPSVPAKNPFDQFDTPSASLPPSATFDASPAGAGSATLPPGATLDPPAQTPGFLDRIGGIAGRGILNGVADVASLAQAGGRIADRAWGATGLPDPTFGLDARLDNVPVASLTQHEMDRQGFYQPTGAGGRAAEAAIEGLTGGALTGGGASTGLLGLNAAVGATGSLAQSAGASPDAALALSLGVGGMGAARSLAGNAAASGVVSRLAPAVRTDQDAAASVVRTSQALDRARSAAPNATPSALSSTVSGSLQQALNGHVRVLRKAGMIGADDAADIKQAISNAADPNYTASSGGLVDGLGLPQPLAKPLQDGLDDLQLLSSGVMTGPASGPLQRAGAMAARYGVPVATALAGLHSGDLAPVVEGGAALLGIAHRPVGQFGAAAGGLLDRLAGTRVQPGQAITNAATATLDGASPGALPIDQLADVRTAYRQAEADAATDATKSAQTNASWKANTAATAQADATWTKALDVKAKQDGKAAVDPLDDAYWPQSLTAPNLAATTKSQIAGFNASTGGQILQAAQGEAGNTAAQGSAQAASGRGTDLSEQAGSWLERQLIAASKRANPGVPVTGAAALAGRTPQDLFAATGGRYGSPGDSTPPMTGFQSPSEAPPGPSSGVPAPSMPAGGGPTPAIVPGAPGGSSGAGPVAHLMPEGVAAAAAPTAQLMPPSTVAARPAFPAAANPGGLMQAPTGGKALAVLMHKDLFPGQATPTGDELSSAIDDIAADGLVHPAEADAAHAGQNVTPDFAFTIAHRVNASRSAPASAAAQASSEVSGLLGGSMPPDVDRFGQPVRSPYSYAAARSAYQDHADAMIALAPTAAEKTALSQVKNTQRGAEKQAIRDVYAAQNPGANLSRFTPLMLRGS